MDVCYYDGAPGIFQYYHIIILEMDTLQIFRPLSKNNSLVESVYIATKCMIHIKT